MLKDRTKPEKGDYLDLEISEAEDGAVLVGRFEVMDCDHERDYYLIQMKEMRREKPEVYNDELPI